MVRSGVRTMATRITVANPVVDLDGDEMTRVIWQQIKDKVRTELLFRTTGQGGRPLGSAQ